jgi:hypothetical protein
MRFDIPTAGYRMLGPISAYQSAVVLTVGSPLAEKLASETGAKSFVFDTSRKTHHQFITKTRPFQFRAFSRSSESGKTRLAKGFRLSPKIDTAEVTSQFPESPRRVPIQRGVRGHQHNKRCCIWREIS